MSDSEEAELCSEKEAKVRHFHHCRIFSVVMWGKRTVYPPREIEPPSLSERLSARQMSSVEQRWPIKGCAYTQLPVLEKVCLLLLRSQTACKYSLFKPLLRFVQVQTWSRSLVYTLEELECKICYNRYDSHSRKPKLLGCLHRVCAKCLKKMVNIGESTCLEMCSSITEIQE